MKRLSLFLLLFILVTGGWASTAAAQVTVTFYSHGWGIGPGGVTYFPHAFIKVAGTPLAGGEAVDRTFGFTATDLTTAMTNRPGIVKPADPRYIDDSTPHFSVVATDEQYAVLLEKIRWWMTPEGSVYNLKTRNCIHFVAEMAEILGLKPGNTRTWKPVVFMTDTEKKNPGKLTIITAGAKARPETAPPPEAAALQEKGPDGN
ncbi:hypothetical protein [Caulobacter mirabilis]|uniref:hypothetical protein n=1 Tax=Caulobacter mirabilis TaxID=69666 RepID=UPI00123772BA|nr:hypothetical protein [Caulobacter mirabilis]